MALLYFFFSVGEWASLGQIFPHGWNL